MTPSFEEPSVRQSLGARAWQEHEDPLALVAGLLSDRKLASGSIGIAGTDRYFTVDGLRKALPGASLKNCAPGVSGCRTLKSLAEIALLQRALDITIAAYLGTIPGIESGMQPGDISATMDRATATLGGTAEFSPVLLGEAEAHPHCSGKPQEVKPDELGVRLEDCIHMTATGPVWFSQPAASIEQPV